MSVFHETVPFVLASASPRRQLFFKELGLSFEVVTPQDEEPRPGKDEAASDYAVRTARAKALDVSARRPAHAVVAADTIVVLGGDILGKPDNERESLAMLERLAGRTHEVITAVCVISPAGERVEFCCSSRVRFHDWPRDVLAAYAATGEPLDKAGSYAVQGLGSFLVAEIQGSWSSVVGLPVAELAARLTQMGLIEVSVG